MDERRRIDLITCPHCGARRPNDSSRCWLCGVHLIKPAGPVPWIVPQPPQVRSTLGAKNIAAILAGLLVVLVAAEVINQAPGLGVALLVFVVPALIALGVTLGREGAGAPSFGGVFAMVMFSMVGLLIVVGLVVAAAIAAITAFCSMMFGIGPR